MSAENATYEELAAAYTHMRDLCRDAQDGWAGERRKLWAAEDALRKIRRLKPQPIGDTGFQTGPAALFAQAQRIASDALKAVKTAHRQNSGASNQAETA